MALLYCLQCGSTDHNSQLCPNQPADVASRLSGERETQRRDLTHGDSLTIWIPSDPYDGVIYLGVMDADAEGSCATAALSLDEAARLGAELSHAAVMKREQVG